MGGGTRQAVAAGVLLILVGASPAWAKERSPVLRDVEGYAVASCLVGQNDAYLKDQGDGWGSVIVQRAKGGLDDLTAVAAAVKAELAKGNMAVIRSETAPTGDKALPVLFCGEIIDRPGARAAITKAVTKLSPAYRR